MKKLWRAIHSLRVIRSWRAIRSWLALRICLGLCAAAGWWGLLYPELALTPDTVAVSEEDEEGALDALPWKWSFGNSLYLDLLHAAPEQITFRSRLLAGISSFWEAFHGRDRK